ncbi:hypothetical protein D3C86_2022070 [compost metagenome]
MMAMFSTGTYEPVRTNLIPSARMKLLVKLPFVITTLPVEPGRNGNVPILFHLMPFFDWSTVTFAWPVA